MIQPSTYLVVPGLLIRGELEIIESLMRTAPFQSGETTATTSARSVKNNLQMPMEGSVEKKQIDEIVLQALAHSPLVQTAMTPVKILPPIISKYEPGMHYGYHVDSPIMAHAQTGPIRADVAMTIFLADPGQYEGGELSLIAPGQELRYKLAKGDAILYPCTQVHAVLPVTKGIRLAAVTWMQCAVSDPMKRELLFEIKTAQALIEQRDSKAPENLVLLQAYSNLMRMWAEL
mgnify:CR=1 FL=1